MISGMSCRETALNVFLGAVLLGIPFLFFFLVGFAANFLFHALSLGISTLYPPAAAFGDNLLYLLFPALLMFASLKDLFSKHWRAAFLDFAAGATILLGLVRDFHATVGFNIPVVVLFVILFASPSLGLNQDLPRTTFLIASAFLCFAALAPLGLLGSGQLSHSTDRFLTLLAVVWFFWRMRKGWPYATKAPDSSAGVVQAS